MCSIIKVFLKISQNSLEKTCVEVSIIRKDTLKQMFYCEFDEILRTPVICRTPGDCFFL